MNFNLTQKFDKKFIREDVGIGRSNKFGINGILYKSALKIVNYSDRARYAKKQKYLNSTPQLGIQLEK